MNYTLTEYTPEGYANNKYYATEEEARTALTTITDRYNSRPVINSIQFRIWTKTHGLSHTVTTATVPANATIDQYNAYIDSLSN